MLDFKEMLELQNQGSEVVSSLPDSEKDLLKYFCHLATTGILQEATRRKAPVADVVLNSYRAGLAMGLQLKVEQGEIKRRL